MRLLFAIILIALALVLVTVVLLVRPAWSGTRCTTNEEQTLGDSSVWRGEYRYFLRYPEDFKTET